jgi:transposase
VKISSFIDFKKKYETGPFRWQVIKLYRLGVVKERQVLTELDLSLSSLRTWNRAYQRYRLRRYYLTSRFRRLIMTPTQEIASLNQQLAQTQLLLDQEKLKREAAETMITIAENEFKIPIRKKSGSGG